MVVYANWGKVFPKQAPVPAKPVSLAGAATKGSSASPVVVLEFSDYFCPYCARAEREVIPAIESQFVDTGKVMLAFRHHPLEQLHPGATAAAVAAVCAGQFGRFWEMHRDLFLDHQDVTQGALVSRADAIAVEREPYSKCLASEEARLRVARDIQEASTLGLGGTPVFLIGRRQPDGTMKVASVIDGARPIQEFENAIVAALDSERPLKRWGAAVAPAVAAGVVGVVWVKRRRVRKRIK